jgi:hypothetical protein
LSFVIRVTKPRVCEHVFPECNVMQCIYSPGLTDWVFPECSQSVQWFCFERVSKFFRKGTKGPTTCRQGLNGSQTLHLGYQLLSTWFHLQGQDISARSISTHTSKNGLYTIIWTKYSLQVLQIVWNPVFDLYNIMAMIQWPPIGPIKGNDCVWLVDHNDWPW